MPLHDDEMKKRRDKREALRRKKEAEARRLKRTLLVAVLVLGLCAWGIYSLVQRGQDEAAIQAARPTEATTEETEYVAPVLRDPITTIHIRAAGDLNITTDVVESGVTAMGYNYTAAFRDVAAVMSEADLTVLNLEGNICGEPYGSDTTSAPIELLQGLRNIGVDMVQVANSCTVNNGMNGLNTTLQAIRSAGIEPLGAYGSEAELRSGKGYTMTEVRGVKIAFVAFTKGLGGRGMPAGNESLVNLLYEDYYSTYQTIDEKRIVSILKAAEAEKPDITIAMLHWGSEYNDDISRSQERLVSLMQKNGVDVIIGSHPHRVQPIVHDPVKGTLVAYSLGDFFGDATRAGTEYSIVLDLEITSDSTTGTTKVTGYSYIPIYTVKPSDSHGDYSYSRVMRIDKALEAYLGNFLDKINDNCETSMRKALSRIAERVVMPKDEDK